MGTLSTQRQARSFGVWILPLFLLGLFFDAHHRSEYAHEVCPVDGQLTHVDDDHHHEPNSHSHESEEGGEEEDHEHCGLPTLGMASDVPSFASPQVFIGALLKAESAPAPEANVEPCEALYRLAPKNSPPNGS